MHRTRPRSLSAVGVMDMRHTKEAARWRLFEWIVTLLLAMSTALLGACALLAWLHLSAVSRDTNSSVMAKNEMDIGSALSAFKEQQVLSNAKLDAIKNELHALNDKAVSASSLTLPSQISPSNQSVR
jgi:hypothetical protein